MYDDVSAVCPFYLNGDKRKISCEGITEGCKTTLEFERKADRDLHRQTFCNSKFKNCEIYAMLEAKYEEE